MFIPYSQNQQFLLPPSFDELIEENHLGRVVNEVVEKLNIEQLISKYTDFGRPGYNPKMLLKIIFYAYSTGLRSSRKIAKAVESDIVFMWLAAMNKPDFRTISEFRKNNLKEIKQLFKQIVTICIELNMASIGKIAIDGTKIKAVSSRSNIRSKKSMKKTLDKLDQEIANILEEAQETDDGEDELHKDKRGDELADKKKRQEKIQAAFDKLAKSNKKKIVTTEYDAALVKTEGRVSPGYNAQAVASNEGFILAEDVSVNSSDNHLAKTMIEETIENTKVKPNQILMDGGYYSAQTLKCLDDKKLDGYLPIPRKKEADSKYKKEDFKYERSEDCYICPEGSKLIYERTYKDKKTSNDVRRYRCKNKDCPQKFNCTNQAKRGRSIDRLEHEGLITNMREKMKKEEAMNVYKRRKVMIEPAFSITKGVLDFKRFSLGGYSKAKGEWSLVCCAFNIFKIYKGREKQNKGSQKQELLLAL